MIVVCDTKKLYLNINLCLFTDDILICYQFQWLTKGRVSSDVF